MLKLLCGNVIDVLRTLPDGSVHCVVTSPPYWGLRDYKTEPVVWGAGDCEHDWVTETVVRENRYGLGLRDSPASTRGGAVKIAEVGWQQIERGLCSKCGAWRGSLGGEPLHDCLAWARSEDPCPICYVCHLRVVWRELWRVLRKDGTCFLVIGDSQSSGSRTSYDHDPKLPERQGGRRSPTNGMGLKPKDMACVPWRVALALQHDGWYLRRDIVWAKPNPMPESVTDRTTRSHECVLHLARSERYYYDREAVLEPSVTQDPRRSYTSAGAWDLDGRPESRRHGGKPRDQLPVCYKGSAFDRGKTAEHQLERAQQGGRRALVIADDRKDLPTDIHSRHRSPIPGGQSLQAEPTMGRNLRDVWTIATVPFKGAHFAVFPPKLVEPCIKAGTSERGCCPQCGASWTRITERETRNLSNAAKAGTEIEGKGHPTDQVREGHDIRNGPTPLVRSLGWRQSCQCSAHESIPCTVLDPFTGSGTVGAVALPLSRSFIGIDLNPDYIALARRRIAGAIVKEKRVCNPKKP